MRVFNNFCPKTFGFWCVLLGVGGLAAAPLAHANSPLLRCHVTYAGSTQVVQAQPVADPYGIPSVDIGGRFWFKAVMVGSAQRVDSISLYAYPDTRAQPLLIQQVTYLPPFKATTAPHGFTGEQHLYAGPVERELIYHCTLQGVQP